jgi:hypothetical protein
MCTASPDMHVAEKLLQQRLPTPFLYFYALVVSDLGAVI